jgi:2,4-dienoyl-CoA reductase-like NADH-dependent reductase (Old Yellow Enzyme family)/pyruvate/2-oxoglutarate dehydrogenase complex dihydrolipoamide dehydrogenase (E3) component
MRSRPSFAHLLAPGRIGSLELRNRIVMCPMGHHLSNPDGSVSANEAAYFEARARGGAALLLVGNVGVASPVGTSDGRMTAASDDERHLPGLTDLAARVHRHGARIAAQLNHQGSISLLDVAEGRPVLVPYIPGPRPDDPLSGMVTAQETAGMMAAFTRPGARFEYRVASENDLAWVISRFAEAADRCARAGFDGVELHAGHGYLIDEFLSPKNTRDDGWGGSIEGRARLLVEVVIAVRARVGRDFPVWIRINALEPHKADGERWDDQLRAIELAVSVGIDAVHVTAYADDATGPTDSYAPHVVGPLSDYAADAKTHVDVPVITFGRFEPHEADRVIADGKADFVAMGRKLLADPDLPNKLADGRVDDIRPCIYQYRCIGNIYVSEPLRCVANAMTGREHDVALEPTTSPRHVLVAGGGAAGLEAARLLAARGHRVSLWEASDSLGGVLRHAGCADPVLDRYLGWLVHEVEHADLAIEVGRTVDPESASALGPDEIVVATGAVWTRPRLAGADQDHVLTVPDLEEWLLGLHETMVGPHVVVLGGGKAGLSMADLCRRRGHEVVVVEPSGVFGVQLGLPGRFRIVHDLEQAGVRLLGRVTLQSIGSRTVRVRGDDAQETIPADTVIITSGEVPDTRLAVALRSAGVPVRTIGGCREVRWLEGANQDALDAARAI